MKPETATSALPACVSASDVFQHPLLEDGLPSGASREVRRQQARLTAEAAQTCASCPLLATCLYDAVVKHDVSGFVAGTTQRQRQEMRTMLQVTVAPEDLDTLAGVAAAGRQVNHDEVLRLRSANPHESLETIAQRLGCSLSTVKRHLRKARNGESTPKLTMAPPTMEQLLAAYAQVVRRTPQTRRAA
ncbi:MAG: WhiB family transcriptional regulator [Actinomycetia bacterium]|nr:WhiB family transcriptional regulator [Actinomycetes bacterium]